MRKGVGAVRKALGLKSDRTDATDVNGRRDGPGIEFEDQPDIMGRTEMTEVVIHDKAS